MSSFVINKANKTYDFNDGTSVPIPEEVLNEVTGKIAGKTPESISRKESFKKGLQRKKSEFGEGVLGSLSTGLIQASPNILTAPGDYLSAISDAYLQKSKGKTDLSLFDKVIDNYYAQKDARTEFKNDLTEKEPIASYAGKGVGLAGEIAATAALPGVAAAPLLGFANSNTSVLEPLNVAKEAGIDAALGFGADKVFKGLATFAGKRGARQAEKLNIADVEAKNVSRGRAADVWNNQEANRFAQETAAREAQMAAIPGQQAAAQQAFSGNVAQNVSKIGDTLGKAKVAEEALGLDNFILNNVDRSALAGTPEANKFVKFIKTIFNSNGKGVDKAHLNQAFQAIEGRIAQVEGAEKDLLLKLKDEMTNTLSQAIPEAAIYHQFGEPLAKEVVRDAENIIKQNIVKNNLDLISEISAHLKQDFSKGLEDSIKNDIQSVFQKYSGNFSDAISNGSIQAELQQILSSNPLINSVKSNPKIFLSKKVINELKQFKIPLESTELFQKSQRLIKTLDDLPNQIIGKMEQNLGKKGNQIAREKIFQTQEINKILPNIKGAPQTISEPAVANAVRNVTPNLEAVPTLSKGQGIADKFANFLEDTNVMEKLKSLKGGLGGATAQGAGLGFLGKLAGIPVAKTVGFAGAGLAGVNLLTRPGASGNIARNALKQGMLQSYLSMRANNYPSFREGILDDPNDRRMFTREIEDDPSLSLEDKAVYQTKINRGQPL